MSLMKHAMLQLLKDPAVQAEIRNSEDVYHNNDNLLKQSDEGVLSMAGFLLGDNAQLSELARPMVQLSNPPAVITSQIVRFYFYDEPEAEEVRQEVLRIYREAGQP